MKTYERRCWKATRVVPTTKCLRKDSPNPETSKLATSHCSRICSTPVYIPLKDALHSAYRRISCYGQFLLLFCRDLPGQQGKWELVPVTELNSGHFLSSPSFSKSPPSCICEDTTTNGAIYFFAVGSHWVPTRKFMPALFGIEVWVFQRNGHHHLYACCLLYTSRCV